MADYRWILFCHITFWSSIFAHLMFGIEGISTSPFEEQHVQPSLQFSPKELRRLRAKGLEIIPSENSISGGKVSKEPTCEELRAMWRYYRRHARAAELTNQIPQFQLEDLFWGVGTPGEPMSFGSLKGRSRPRFRPKGPRDPLYGRVLFKQEKIPESSQRRRPMEEVISMFGIPSSTLAKSPNIEKSDEPTILISPPLEPTPQSGLEKIKEIFRDERVKAARDVNPNFAEQSQGQDYGKIILSPPHGQDGRVANKPRELMTPFERIRFGHADDLFNGNDDMLRRRGSNLFPVKRRNGFIALPMLNRQRSSWTSFLPKKTQKESLKLYSIPKFEDSIIMTPNENFNVERRPGAMTSLDDTSQPKKTSIPTQSLESFHGDQVKGSNEDLISLMGEYEQDNTPLNILLDKESLFVDESVPLCLSVKDRSCSTNAQCSCVGYGLYRCYSGQCQTLSLKGTVSQEKEDEAGFSEIWHMEPLDSSQLGIWEDSSLPIDESFILENQNNKGPVDVKNV